MDSAAKPITVAFIKLAVALLQTVAWSAVCSARGDDARNLDLRGAGDRFPYRLQIQRGGTSHGYCSVPRTADQRRAGTFSAYAKTSRHHLMRCWKNWRGQISAPSMSEAAASL